MADEAELLAKIARLERRLERERSARLEAEAIAEQGLREMYDRHQSVRLLHGIGTGINQADSVEEALRVCLREICDQSNWSFGHAFLVDRDSRKLVSSRVGHTLDPERYAEFESACFGIEFTPGLGIPGRVWATNEPAWMEEIEVEFAYLRRDAALVAGLRCGLLVPVSIGSEPYAVLEFYAAETRPRDDHFIDIVMQVGNMLGRVVERLRAEANTRRHVARLRSLQAIDSAITASLDLDLTLGVFIDQVLALLGVDAAEILLYNPHTHTLHPSVGKGFRMPRAMTREVRLGQGHCGTAALRRRIVHVPDVRIAADGAGGLPAGEEFVGTIAVPLVAKGGVKGILQVYRRSELACDADLSEFVQALARQAAIAVDNATLFDGLQRSNIELSLAYDATIEGWSHALDLRDKETEGHTRRVTELTMRLARAMDVPEADLVHIRRGALLHDIGKMGIPDAILHKPGPLDEEEWVIMRTHPTLAYELLSGVEFLRPALDIPYGHHEKWDGTGYPRGLAREAIPLAARIFAIVDVWDALRSDRPYKKGWSFEKALEHVGSQGGRHFDPRVAECFVRMMQADAAPQRGYGLRMAA